MCYLLSYHRILASIKQKFIKNTIKIFLGMSHCLSLLIKSRSLLGKDLRVLSKILINYCKIILLRKNVLRCVEISPLYNCQFNCLHCYAHGLNEGKQNKLSLNELKQFINEATELGAINFHIVGGEPLLYKNLYNLIKHIRSKNSFVSLSTNGFLLNKKSIKKLKSSGLNNLVISICSDNAHEHDRIVGVKGSFESIINSVETCKNVGINVELNTIATPKKINSGKLLQIINVAKEMNLKISLNIPCALGKWKNNTNIILSDYEWGKLMKLTRIEGVRWEGNLNYLQEGCPAGIEKIHLTPYGDVIPCSFIYTSFGNIRRNSLDHIWAKMVSADMFKKMDKRCLAGKNISSTNKIKEYEAG